MFNAITSGFPSSSPTPFPAGSNTVTDAIDTNSGATWNNVGAGWQPDSNAFAKSNVLGVTAAQASLLVFTAPVTGIYQVTGFAIQSTATGTTTGAITVSYTEGETSVSVSSTSVAAATALTGQGTNINGTVAINVKAGTTVTVAAAAVSGTGGAVNLKARVAYLG